MAPPALAHTSQGNRQQACQAPGVLLEKPGEKWMRQKDADRQDLRIKLINVHEVTQVDYHTQEDVIQCCMPIGQDKLVVNIKEVLIGIAPVEIAGIKEECTVRCCAKRGGLGR
jgi:hypothetical protein